MRFTVKFKLLLLLCIPMLLFMFSAISETMTNSSNIKHLSGTLYETSYQGGNLVLQADRDLYQALNDYNLLRFASLPDEDYAQSRKDFGDNVQQAEDRLNQAAAIFERHGIKNLTAADGGKTVGEAIDAFKTGFEKWSKEASANVESRKPPVDADEIALSQIFNESRASVDTLENILDSYAAADIGSIQDKNKSSKTSAYLTLGIEWFAIALLGYLLLRYISRSLGAMSAKTKAIAEGNLQQQPLKKYRNDELGELNRSIDTMIGNIRRLVGQITDNAQTVAVSAVELSASAKESAATSTQVAENIRRASAQAETQSIIAEETSRAVEEMAVGVQRIAENTSSIADHSTQASDKVEHGSLHMNGLKRQLEGIFQGLEALSRTVEQLTNKSEKIGQITENITAFANRTNILSFNASIEAARSGEHGKGFAVVAQEIRKLAAGSIESAEVISALIAETRSEIADASESMHKTLAQAGEGERMMSEVARDFDSILEAVKQVSEQVHETSAITEQMSASSEEVSASMEQSATSARESAGLTQAVSAATEEQLALVENISGAAERLQNVVGSLKESVSRFRI